ncbi:MAG: hypothetical protein KDC79_17470 [Cyclobacteriaceae bacterium]|nr:hypothetical protein [Cyclobacteriaceae bacterium]
MTEPFISYHWNDDFDSLKIGQDHIYIRNNRKFYHFQIAEIISAELVTKKKLAPLIAGAVISSLATVNIILEGASMYIIALLFVGLLILYFGLTDYWVVKIVNPRESALIWINKNKTPHFPEKIFNFIHYRIKQGDFPPFYCQVEKSELQKFLEEKNESEPGFAHVNYSLLPPKPLKNNVILKVSITELSKPIVFNSESGYIAYGEYKINGSAIMGMEL